MRPINFLDPRTELATLDNFKELSFKKKAIVILVSAVAAVAFLGYGGFVTFRALVYHFSKVEPSNLKTHTRITSLIKEEIVDTLSPTEMVNNEVCKMIDWKQFMYRGLQKEMEKINKRHGLSEENPDCFFDSFSQAMKNNNQRASISKKIVRICLHHHLSLSSKNNLRARRQNERLPTYENIIKENLNGYNYQDIIDNLPDCVDEIPDENQSIWMQVEWLEIIASIYKINIQLHSVTTRRLTLEESNDNRWNEFEKYQHTLPNQEIVVEVPIVTTNVIQPLFDQASETIEIAKISRDSWNHFVPIFPRR